MNGYQYEAVFTNSLGSGDHHGGHADRPDAPTSRRSPASQTVAAGRHGELHGGGQRQPDAQVQWEVNTGSGYTNLSDGGVYSGSSTDTLTITAATAAMNGYQYEAVFSNTAGTPTTTAATLTVETPRRDRAARPADGAAGGTVDASRRRPAATPRPRAVGGQHRQRLHDAYRRGRL